MGDKDACLQVAFSLGGWGWSAIRWCFNDRTLMAPPLGISIWLASTLFSWCGKRGHGRGRGWWERVVAWARAVAERWGEGTTEWSTAGFAGPVGRPAGTGWWVQRLFLEPSCLQWFVQWLRHRDDLKRCKMKTHNGACTHTCFSNLNPLTALTCGPLRLRVNWDGAQCHCREWRSQMLCLVSLLFSEGTFPYD